MAAARSELVVENLRTEIDPIPVVQVGLSAVAHGGDRPPTPMTGLTTTEADARRKQGLGNYLPMRTTRSYWQILHENALTFINIALFILGIALVALGRPTDVLVAVGVVIVNILVSGLQEVRAKRKLDRIALLTRPSATVIRDGQEGSLDPGQVVLGDLLVVRSGDQVVADGRVISSGQADMDESLLTGESEVVPKSAGDSVYAGTFCVQGTLIYEAERVGAASTASQITSTARAFRRVATPLQFHIALVVRVLLMVAVFIEVLIAGVTLIYDRPMVTSMQNAVVVAGLVPQALFLAIAVSYALGAVRIAGRAVLIQQANAVESMSNVDTLCLDKTGTLTTNRIRLHDTQGIGIPEGELRRLLGDFACSVAAPNRTSQALAEALPGSQRHTADEVPFSSERKWSGLTLDDTALRGSFVLGAPEILRPHVVHGAADEGKLPVAWWATGEPGHGLDTPEWGQRPHAGAESPSEPIDWYELAEAWADRGLRVVLFAAAAPLHAGIGSAVAAIPLRDAAGQPCLPQQLQALGLIAFSDELRPDAGQTLARFRDAGIDIKIISGDSPHTVAALARQAGMGPEIRTISGQKLASMDHQQFSVAAESTTVFGRITPQQKAALVQALKERGRYVAMTGDGINDVVALKQAHLGIAMESGSQATRAVADMVLLGDSFAALPSAFEEGQRIRNGMQDVLRLFLTRLLVVTLLVGAVGFVGGFPFTPKQVTLVGFLTVGVPTVALAARAGTGTASTRDRLLTLFHFVLPAGLSLGLTSLTTYLVLIFTHSRAEMAAAPWLSRTAALQISVPAAQSGLAAFLVFSGLLLVPFAVPPFAAFWHGVAPTIVTDKKSIDPRPTIVALILLLGYVIVVSTPWLRSFFDLAPLSDLEHALIAAQAIIWALLMRWAWRSRVLERFLYGELTI